MHTSIAKSLEHAALKAHELRANTFQIFSASPRMWRASMPSREAVTALRRAREKHDLSPLVIHDNYLINLSAADPIIREKSIAAFRGEIERALAIGAEYLVAHPGNCRGLTVEHGIALVVEGIARAAEGLDTRALMLLLENTAGMGCALGSRFEELALIRQIAREHTELEIGYCIDTCHCLVSGYDISTEIGFRKTVRQMDQILDLDRVRVIHTNDSKTPVNSRVDRHQHIGKGYIGLEGFRRFLTHRSLSKKVFILETPIDKPGDDRRNLQTIRSLCPKSSTTHKPSK
jgi:deoxyribonuclease IV